MKVYFIDTLVFFLLISLSLVESCSTNENKDSHKMNNINLIRYVNPYVGTKNMGHTYPGATAPFGMVQLSPETSQTPLYINGKYNPDVYRYCSGYQYDDSLIYGFAHTHFSGTGHSDLGDFLIMPTLGKVYLTPFDSSGENHDFASVYDKKSEFAEPGYYSVLLKDNNIKAELTASERVGFHRYSFPTTDSANIILDLISNIYPYDGKNVWTFIRVENDTLVTGYRETTGWARTRKVFFAMAFSKPFYHYGQHNYDDSPYKGFYRKFDQDENFPEMAGRKLRVYFTFKTEQDETIEIKFALSPVSTEGALKNLEKEIPHWDFEKIKLDTQTKWNKELSKIIVESLNEKDKETFYTALYHTMLSPIIYEDVDGQYRGLDQNIHQSNGFVNYTIFSLWDTYRALHPLFNLIQTGRNKDMIKSMLAHYRQSAHHMLPVWSHYANENWCMIGYHATSVIADALVKNPSGLNIDKLLKASVNTSRVSYFDGIGDYMKFGYVPEDKNSSSVSKTLEYAYDDWCIAQTARLAGDTETENEYLKRSENYRNVFDKETGFMQPKLSDGRWKKIFDPMDTHGQGFIEGNAWNYSLYVPQQPDTLVKMMGGKERFCRYLDSLFTMKIEDKYIEKTEDITRDGIIGNYVQGNEPGHHIPYLYDWTDEPWKTQQRVRIIMETMYSNTPDGLCGNDDCGQMSAWYIFSALGFYPVCPGSEEYAVGSPLVKSATIHFENGKQLHIKTEDQGEKNVYIQKITLNGREIDQPILKHSELLKGGDLVFTMGNKPLI